MRLFLCFIYAFLLFLSNVLGDGSKHFVLDIVCKQDFVTVYIRNLLDTPFTGFVYTEGSFKDNKCSYVIDGKDKISVDIPYNDCKTIEEPKGTFTNVLILQRDARLLTVNDAAFKIKCDESSMKYTTNKENSGMITLSNSIELIDETTTEHYDPMDNDKPYSPKLKYGNIDKHKLIYTDKKTIIFTKKPSNYTNKIVKTLITDNYGVKQ